MATKRELLTLSKKIFEHFTNESLQLAKQLIAMEKELDEEEKTTPGASTKPILEIKIPESAPILDRPAPKATETEKPVLGKKPVEDLPF